MYLSHFVITIASHFFKICKAVQEMHNRGIVHNDLHSRNVLLRDGSYVKVIDFGKATLIHDPVVYDVKPGSEKQKTYNRIHRHLAYELRNVPDSYNSEATDIYSLGYLMDRLSVGIKFEKLSSIALQLMAKNPKARPLLPSVVNHLRKIIF